MIHVTNKRDSAWLSFKIPGNSRVGPSLQINYFNQVKATSKVFKLADLQKKFTAPADQYLRAELLRGSPLPRCDGIVQPFRQIS